ncbi:flagellar hook protein FlgE [Neptunomonas antarctica]|uniref:Flagellar hook protein FlgE n=1 Tax=Neptunomonas antarctica TaxID=619304 RepID=A0A1N7JBT3_9GAMM|nr:flagellar hook protein FlgE [Neptunomonas antarctica]SIS46736.1 flagellar hook protein FlgE [Neptunomonas antarctica]
MAGFNTAVTGIKASSTMLDVAGNNIANSGTVGFKASRTEFGDIYATAVVGAGSSNLPGSGVTVSGISQDFSAGTAEFTNNNLDLAINGSGFFQLDDGQGGTTYTRAGAFELDSDGFIVSKNGKYLQGFGLDALGNQLPLQDLAVDEKESPPHATETIDLAFNIDSKLDSTLLSAVYDKNNPNSFSYTTTVETFDSLGNAQTVKYNFAEQRPVREQYVFDVAGSDVTISGLDIADASNLTPTEEAALQLKDPRIDTDSITYDGTAGTLSFELKSESSAVGDVRVRDGGGTVDLSVANLDDGEPHTRTANEIQSFLLNVPAPLAAAGSVEIGGVAIAMDAGMDAEAVGAAVVAAQEKIIEKNPDVQAVQYNKTSKTLYITWNAEAGPVDSISKVDSGGLLVADDPLAEPLSQEGDNSFMGVYRMYAYLNDAQQLDIGKRVDPGEVGFDNDATEVGALVIKFDTTTGVLSSVDGEDIITGAATPKITIRGADPANPNDIKLDSDTDNLVGVQLDIAGSSQFSSDSIVKKAAQDGYTKGDLIGVTFEETGEMVASFSNGQRQNLGLVAIANFENQSGLQSAGDTEWVASLSSGQAIVNPPGTGLNGTLRSASLEQSNVDLSAELVKLIEAQRNFQANSKTLETLNTVTQAILQI